MMRQLEVLWTGRDAKEEFAVVRVPPEKLHRVRRSPRTRFIIPNLQRWIEANAFGGFSSSSNLLGDSGDAVFSSLVSNFR